MVDDELKREAKARLASMEMAITAVQTQGVTIRQAALQFKVNRSTLTSQLRARASGIAARPRGRQHFLSPDGVKQAILELRGRDQLKDSLRNIAFHAFLLEQVNAEKRARGQLILSSRTEFSSKTLLTYKRHIAPELVVVPGSDQSRARLIALSDVHSQIALVIAIRIMQGWYTSKSARAWRGPWREVSPRSPLLFKLGRHFFLAQKAGRKVAQLRITRGMKSYLKRMGRNAGSTTAQNAPPTQQRSITVIIGAGIEEVLGVVVCITDKSFPLGSVELFPVILFYLRIRSSLPAANSLCTRGRTYVRIPRALSFCEHILTA